MFLITPLSSDALCPMNPSNIGTNLILAETRVIGLHLCRWQYRSIFIQIFTVSSERRTCFETERIMSLQGHPRSLILAPIESAYMTSYSTFNLGPILPRFRDIRAFVRRKPLFQHPTPIRAKISGVPFGADASCWGCKEQTSQAN